MRKRGRTGGLITVFSCQGCGTLLRLPGIRFTTTAAECLKCGAAHPLSSLLASSAEQTASRRMIEFALVIGLIVLGATAAMGAFAIGINHAMNHIATRLTFNIT